jgi:hypothetical protein
MDLNSDSAIANSPRSIRFATVLVATLVLVSGCKKEMQVESIILPPRHTILSIDVAILEVDNVGLKAARYRIDPVDWPIVLDHLIPAARYPDWNLDNDIYPVICHVDITATEYPTTRLMVRSMGKNPLLLSKDNRTYFWADSPPGVTDSAMSLIAVVQKRGRVVENK